MKKTFAIIVAVMMLMSATAMAELVVEKTEYTTMTVYDTVYAYFFAEVTNTGDAPISVEGNYDLLDASGNAVISGSVYSGYPYVIAPGATGFVECYEYCDTVASPEDIPDIRYTLVAGDAYSEPAPAVTVTDATCAVVENSWGETVCEVIVTIKNDTADTIVEPDITFGMYDQAGEMLYTDSTTLYSVAVPAGQSIQALFYADDDFVNIWTEDGRTPTEVKALAYVE